MKNIYLILLYCALALPLFSCSENEKKDSEQQVFIKPTVLHNEQELEEALEEYRINPSNFQNSLAIWRYYTNREEYRKIVEMAKPLYEMGIANKDLNVSLASAAYLTQSYVFLDIPDSAKYYFDCIKNYDTELRKLSLFGMAYNSAAIYSMKFEMNYPMALDYFNKTLDYYTQRKDTVSKCIILCNVADIYYLRKDTLGTRYAANAYNLSKLGNNSFLKCFSTLKYAKMQYLAGNYNYALKLINDAETYVDVENNVRTEQFIPEIAMMRGLIYITLGNRNQAKESFDTAFKYLKPNAEKTFIIQLYISYSKYLIAIGEYKEAEKPLLIGLDLSNKNSILEYKYDIYLSLSQVYKSIGQMESAYKYYELYHNISDSIFNIHSEREFNRLLNDLQTVKLKNELQENEIKVIKSGRFLLLTIIIIVIISITLFAIFFLYKRKSRMYHGLVEKHQEFLKKMEELKGNEQAKSDNRNKNEQILYNKLEDLMSKDKIYRSKDLSLDMLAETLETNRTYISIVINKYTNMTFHNYVNMYRINEAIKILSSENDNMPLKAISDSVGYNSMSSFYRAFQKETGCTPTIYREEFLKLQKEKNCES